MNKKYVKPTMNVEKFSANEYLSTCQEGGVSYLFECNAGKGKKGKIVLDSNKNGKFDYPDGEDVLLTPNGNFYACNKKHEASTTSDFVPGWYIKGESTDGLADRPRTPVMVWWYYDDPVKKTGKHVHATTALDINKWDKNFS